MLDATLSFECISLPFFPVRILYLIFSKQPNTRSNFSSLKNIYHSYSKCIRSCTIITGEKNNCSQDDDLSPKEPAYSDLHKL